MGSDGGWAMGHERWGVHLLARPRSARRSDVGGRDERYREEGVAALATLLGVDSELQESPVHIKPETTNETISPLGRVRAYEEIIEYLRTRELMD